MRTPRPTAQPAADSAVASVLGDRLTTSRKSTSEPAITPRSISCSARNGPTITRSRQVVATREPHARPGGKRQQEGPPVCPPPEPGPEHEDHHGEQRDGSDPFEGLRRDRRDLRPERAPRSRAEVERRDVARRRLALAGPAEDHRQLAEGDDDEHRGRREVEPAAGPVVEQRRDHRPGQRTADDAERELEAAGGRIDDPAGIRSEERRVEEDVADPPADHGAGHDAEDDEEQVVAAKAHPAGDRAGDHEGGEDRDRDADRLEADEPVADLQQRVEVERDDGIRHGRQCSGGDGVGWPTPALSSPRSPDGRVRDDDRQRRPLSFRARSAGTDEGLPVPGATVA